ncbi:MAG: ABC transporter substrate-binding protein [Clostridia bacterium]|nr:ABC transporter substrate-binding protein [Clostridia bacterium]
MKRILLFFITLTLFLFPLSGCKKSDDGVLRINEVTDSFFYAPFYVAIEKGFFEEEGLTIELTNGGGSDVSMTALLSGGADIILAGPETAVYVSRQNKKDAPKVFAQLTKRDGCFLISRNAEPNFTWQDIKGKEIIIGRQGGLPAMTFQYIVKNLGFVDGVDLTLRKDIQFPLMAPTFDNGTGDYVTLFEPTATEFVKAGKGHIVASVGKQSGEVPYTSFIALSSFLEKNSAKAEKFLRAMYKAINYTKTANSLEVASYLVKHFTTSNVEQTADSLNNYNSVDTWMSNMCLNETMFNTLLDVIENAGEDVKGVAFNKVVDNTLADKVYKELYA